MENKKDTNKKSTEILTNWDSPQMIALRGLTFSGHLSGSSKVLITRDGQEREMTLMEAYLHWTGIVPNVEHGLCKCGCGSYTRVPKKSNKKKGEIKGVPVDFLFSHRNRCNPWDLSIPSFIQSYDGKTPVLSKIMDIVETSTQYTHRISLNDGHALKCNLDQELLTESGWVTLRDLAPDSMVMIFVPQHNKIGFDNRIITCIDVPPSTKYVQIKSISSFYREETTYLVICSDPDIFVVNGFIVHPSRTTNSRKGINFKINR